MEWIAENYDLLAIFIPLALDILLGVLPDKYAPYVGVTRRALRKAAKNLKKTSIVFLCIVLMGCAPGRVCDTDQPSLVCKVIPQPEHIDILLRLENLRRLQEDAYTADQVQDFLDDCERIIENAGSFADLVYYIIAMSGKIDAPSIIILSPYLELLDRPVPIPEFDRKLLLEHIKRQRNLLELYRRSAP